MSASPWQATGLGEVAAAVPRRTIPFDIAFRYELTGQPENVINKTVTVSIEATFVAVSIGYGVIPDSTPIIFAASPTSGIITGKSGTLTDILPLVDSLGKALGEDTARLGRVGPKTAAALTNGVKLNPTLAERILLSDVNSPLDQDTLDQAFQLVGAPADQIQFLYALFDEGSGREFQSDPVLNIAGLGISNGERPFRYFAKPIVFAPQTTIRMQVTEKSKFQGELHVSLQGYKALGGVGTPTGRALRHLRRAAGR